MVCLLKEMQLFAILLFFSCTLQQSCVVKSEPQVPCYFIFGDSLADGGNNNALLPGGMKANYLPYGIDFPNGPTGRFSNNRTTPDIVGQRLGFDNFIPPFATVKNNDILKGVNYGSAGSGIRDDTGLLGTRISLNMQLQNHRTIVSRIRSMLGLEAANDQLSKCIYSVTIANNDYIANYYKPLSLTSILYTPEQYTTLLVKQFSQQLKSLYNQGARKVAVYGLAEFGCTPFVIATMGKNGSGCVQKLNDVAALFNKNLTSLVDELNNGLMGAKFTYLNSYAKLSDLLGPSPTTTTCCELAAGSSSCARSGNTCSNRDTAVFFDALHPTDAANEVFAGIAYKAQSPMDAHPYDISQLALM